MGSLRTLLAIIVVLTHSYGGLVFIGGQNAVRMFYIISGFLISYVLTEAKTYASNINFYENRILRIYPIYAAVAAITLIFYFIIRFTPFFQIYELAPQSAAAMLAATNITLAGQDLVLFTAVHQNQLFLSSNFLNSDLPLYQGLLIPQAWTLSLELSFYLIAPYVLVRKTTLYLLLLLSVTIRIWLLHIGMGWNDPWSYRFFPAELSIFLVGAIAHQQLLPLYKKLLKEKLTHLSYGVTLFTVGFIGIYSALPESQTIKSVILFCIFSLTIPFAFIVQTRLRWDKWIGELSYPIYIGHMLVFTIVGLAARKMHAESRLTIAVATGLGSIAFAYILNRLLGRPVEQLRNKIRGVARRAERGRTANVRSEATLAADNQTGHQSGAT